MCRHSENCNYFKAYKNSSGRQHHLLVESYCKGQLQSMCRRKQYEKSFGTGAPDTLAPNGYLVGTHTKINTHEGRRHDRYKMDNAFCILQTIETKETFSASIVDISKGGIRLELCAHPEELAINPKKSLLKILNYTVDEIQYPLDKEILKPAWQDGLEIGCYFVASVA